MSNIQQKRLDCGLCIITEIVPGIKTAAFNWGVRAGVATNKHDGDSVLLAELIQRGAGGLSAKEHNNALDSLGIRRQVSCGIEFFQVSAVMLGTHLTQGIPLLGAYLLNPTLPESDLDACKSLCLQSINSIDDNPSQQAGIALNKHHLPSPFNRSAYGVTDVIESATIGRLQNVYQQHFVPNDSILVVAGDVDHNQIIDTVSELVDSWNGNKTDIPSTSTVDRGVHWIKQDTSQVHICFAIDGPNISDSNSILEAVAISVFGGATSGRLFTQVRQRRSLCYSVSAQYAASKERSLIRMHAGTTPERANETIQVCLEQLAELRNGISADELARTIQRLKSRTVMRGESTTARASALWGDQYALGKTRSLQDRLEEIEGVTLENVNNWLKYRDYGELTLVYIGPEDLNLDDKILQLNTL
ncbi:MAG: insulinase family protein [Phycisphaerae bacterium]|jgi:predicted Zn-dependent peptidase|nr:insulinase family protein [Phycisphaerae bacterium]MBT5365637.1 insulinase family protein [Phycisphaerae bacterium]MBT6268909.1 insulinase family protein [Phycisphaerae bacterium]MBT6281967.1 insulinase family protein [Phycisphaerae bacterium]